MIQGFITQPLEQAVAQADNIDFMTSQSVLGRSTITVTMKLNTDPNAALSDVLAKTNSVRSQLPKEAENPTVTMSPVQPLRFCILVSPVMNWHPAKSLIT